MKNRTINIRKIARELNNLDGVGGGFWLPNIQRSFVWKERQIEKLFDSLMRGYPIGALLVWKTKSEIKYRKFIDNYENDIKLTELYVPENEECKLLVLDGQQRLQSLFIGLRGSYNGKELYFNILSGIETLPEDIKYVFNFYSVPPDTKWVKIKDIVFSDNDVFSDGEVIIKKIENELINDEKKRIGRNVSNIHQVFKTEERIVYQELDSIDKPKLYRDNDVVEIFIRANAGGTPLGKSDLLFSLLTSSWDEAEERMDVLLDDLNEIGYSFTRDFVLKTCLTLLNKGASYGVEKFRNEKFKNEIIDKWEEIEISIKDIKDFLYRQTYIKSKKTMKSYLSLIPLIYFRYHYETKWSNINTKYIYEYILKTLLSSVFANRPNVLIDNCIKEINSSKGFIQKDIFKTIRESGKNLGISESELLSQNYSKKNDLHLIFNIWYNWHKNPNYQPSYSNNELIIDHVFSQSLLKEIRLKDNPRKMSYKREYRDQIGNLMLLTREENGLGEKRDIPPSEWLANKDPSYLRRHSIPENRDLWEIDNYKRFIAARNKLIVSKFRGVGMLLKESKDISYLKKNN